jgi:GNAT superfamily N-acetyltransferase
MYEGKPALRVALRVIQPCRRRGVGSRLLAALIEIAIHRRDQLLVACHDPVQGPDGERFLRARAFVPGERVTIFDADLARLQFLKPIKDRLVAMGKVPSTARVVSLHEAPMDRVVRLQVATMGGDPESVRRQLQEGLERGSMRPASVVLMIDDEVQGILLAESEGSTVVVDSNIVAPRYQGGWANVLLKEAALQRALACGAHHLRFAAFATNRDTLKIAARCSARVVEVKDFFTLDLGDAPRGAASDPSPAALPRGPQDR